MDFVGSSGFPYPVLALRARPLTIARSPRPHHRSQRPDAQPIRGVLGVSDQPYLGQGILLWKRQGLQLPSPGSLNEERGHAAFVCSPREPPERHCGNSRAVCPACPSDASSLARCLRHSEAHLGVNPS